MIREIEAARGEPIPRPFSEPEIKYRKYSKKSLVSARALPPGTVIEEKDLLFMRAEALGLPPDQSARLIGKTTRRAVEAFHLILEEDVH
jgi:sialic acid synthase SpsE